MRSHRLEGCGIRWVKAETIHITLKFCGEIPPEMAQSICELIEKEKTSGGFSLSISGIGGFPRLEAPRTIWVGVRGDTERLIKLHQKIDILTARRGVAKEWRKFSPHITLGRRNDGGALPPAAAEELRAASIELPAWRAEEFFFMKSELTPKGPIYTPLRKFIL